jgi:DNA-nicking Smr family endonuclease
MFIFIDKKEIDIFMKKPDFGDILEKWENSTQIITKDTINGWFQSHKVYNKDAEIDEFVFPGEKRRHLLQKKPDDILDIHGFTSENAWLSLENFFLNAKENGCQKIRIIHGKGNHTKGLSALGILVRKYIEKCPFAGESGFEKSANGGSGAVWVLLKN